MFQKLFTKYWVVANIVITVFLTWLVLPESLKSATFTSLLWMSLLLAELFILLPSVFSGETLSLARARAVKSLSWDAFFYAGFFMCVYLAVQWLNGGRIPEYDTSAGVWGFSPPAVSWLPSSIGRIDSFRMFNLFAALLVVGCCIRNAVGKRAKRMLIQWLCIGSGVFAAVAVTRGCLEVEPYKTYMFKPLASSLGTLFGFWMLMSIGAFADALSAHTRKNQILYLLGIVANFVGMLFFAPLPAMMLYTLLGVLMFVYLGLYLSAHVPTHYTVKLIMTTVIITVVVFVLSVLVFPESAIAAKIGLTADVSNWWDTLVASKSVRSDAAMKIWQEHMWYGTGVDGFEHYLGSVLDDSAWSKIRLNKGFVYNDLIQALCELGVLGTAFLAAVVITLIIPLCHRAHIAWTHDTGDSNAGRKYLLRISPLVVAGVVATLCCFAESFVSSPFRMPAVFMSFFVVLLTMPSFLPSR